jgi:hypothetical protein
VALDAAPLAVPASPVLNPGSAPVAATASLPASGPLAGMVVAGLSQKATGTGAALADTALPPGTVLFSIKLDLVATGAPGAVFDGTNAAFTLLSGGLRNRVGSIVVGPKDIAIGKLVVK